MGESLAVYGMLVSYKIAVLIAGLGLAYMGFRLFLADKIAMAGNLEGKAGAYELKITSAAPGVFFSLFGAIVICTSLIRGVHYDATSVKSPSAQVEMLIPNSPPR